MNILLLAVTACATANVVTGLMSEQTGAVYPAAAKTSILKVKDAFEITLESAIAPEGLSRRVLARKDGPSACVGVDDCVFFRCGGKSLFVNFNGAWCGDRPEGFQVRSEVKVQSSGVKVQSSEFKVQSSEFKVQSSEVKVQSSEGRLWICTVRLPFEFCFGRGRGTASTEDKLTIGRRFAYAGPKFGRDASITLDPKTFGDPSFLPPIEDAAFDASVNPFRADESAADRFFCKFAYYPRYHKFRALCDVKQFPDWETRAKIVDCTIADAKGKVLVAREIPVAKTGFADETFDMPDLKAATQASGDPKYEVRLALRGIEGAVYTKNFYRHICEWEGNKYGLSGIVVPPFTPVKREGVGQRSEVRGQTAGEKKVGEGVGADHRVTRSELEKISVVLREHIVDKKTGLWQQVTAAGKDLLARPMALVDAKSVRVPVDAVAHRVDKDGKDPLLTRRASASTGGRGKDSASTGRGEATASTEWDYDGMMEWRLTLNPGHYEPVDLEIPFKAEEGRLMNACVDNIRCNYCGFVPKGEGSVWNGTMAKGRSGLLGDYVPYIWIGGPLRGIAVFGENDKGWVLGGEQKVGGESRSTEEGKVPLSTSTSSLLSYSRPCQEIVREADGTVVLRLHLIQVPCDITEARTIRIGFQATPVKPMAANWRKGRPTAFLGSCEQWGAGPSDSATESWDGTDTFFRKMQEARLTGNIDWAYWSNCVARVVYPGKPGSREWEDRHKRQGHMMRSGLNVARNCGRRGTEMLWYMNARGVVFGNKSGATFADQWSREEFLTMDRDFIPMSHRDYELDPDRDFQDYSAWWYRLMALSGAMDYLYWDDTYLSPNFDLVGTDAYRLPDGRIQPATGVFNMRAYIKRAACVQAEVGRKSDYNWIHETNAAMAPISAFAGVHYDWEDNTRGMSFQKRYPKDYMQAGVIGRQFGVRVSVIGYYGQVTPEKEAWFHRTGTGWCLAHEIFWRHKPYKAALKRLEDWGYFEPDTKVWNYWDDDVAFPVATEGLDVATLALGKVGGDHRAPRSCEALLVVSNAEDTDGAVVLRPDAAALGVRKDFSAVDLETGRALEVRDGKVELELKGDDYAIIVLN